MIVLLMWFSVQFNLQFNLQPSNEVEIVRNLSYAEEHPRQVLDLYLPEDAENAPVLMFVSGGGWTSGSKDWIANLGSSFAAQGFAVALVDHRLQPDVDAGGQATDLAAAVAWLKENIANYGGNPNQIFVGGHSAGGHLITLMLMDPQYLAAHDLTAQDIAGIIPISAVLATQNRFGEELSPPTFLREDLPPFLLLYASGDFPGLGGQLAEFQADLDELDVSATVTEIANRDHFSIVQLIGTPNDETTQIMVEWMISIEGDEEDE